VTTRFGRIRRLLLLAKFLFNVLNRDARATSLEAGEDFRGDVTELACAAGLGSGRFGGLRLLWTWRLTGTLRSASALAWTSSWRLSSRPGATLTRRGSWPNRWPLTCSTWGSSRSGGSALGGGGGRGGGSALTRGASPRSAGPLWPAQVTQRAIGQVGNRTERTAGIGRSRSRRRRSRCWPSWFGRTRYFWCCGWFRGRS